MMASDAHCCAQAQHGSAPDIAGQDQANPVSMILSVAMLIDWLGQKRGLASCERAAAAMSAAVDRVLEDPQSRTADLGGPLGCMAFGERTAAALATG